MSKKVQKMFWNHLDLFPVEQELIEPIASYQDGGVRIKMMQNFIRHKIPEHLMIAIHVLTMKSHEAKLTHLSGI